MNPGVELNTADTTAHDIRAAMRSGLWEKDPEPFCRDPRHPGVLTCRVCCKLKAPAPKPMTVTVTDCHTGTVTRMDV